MPVPKWAGRRRRFHGRDRTGSTNDVVSIFLWYLLHCNWDGQSAAQFNPVQVLRWQTVIPLIVESIFKEMRLCVRNRATMSANS